MSGTGNGRFNETKPSIPELGVDLNKPAETFKFVMGLCAILFVFAVLFFSFMRLRFRQIYAPRFLLLENKTLNSGATPKRTFFSWVFWAFNTSDEDIYTFAGLDALVFLRLMRLLLKFALCTMPYGLIILLPINIYGTKNLQDGLDRISMSNVESGSPHLWAHFVAVWIYSLIIFYLSYQEWKVYVKYRQRYLRKGSGNQFALLVKEIPEQLIDDISFYEAVNELFPNKVSSAYIVRDLKDWDDYIKEHNKYVLKWERAKCILEHTGKRAKCRQGKCCGDQVDAIEYYEEKLERIQEKLISEQLKVDKPPLRCGFVFFKSLKSKTIALQSVWTCDPFEFHVYPAPTPGDMKWDSLKIRSTPRKLLEATGYVLVFFLVLFWAIPITFISSLTNLKTLANEYPSLRPLIISSGWFLSFVQGVLPVILIALFYLFLPSILFLIARFQGNFSGSNCTEMVFKCLFVFQTFNTFFIFIFAGSVLKNLAPIINKPFDIPSLLAVSLPTQSGFFVNYLALVSFVGLTMELTRIWPLIYISIQLKWFAKTDRERLEAWKPKRPEYEVMLSQALLFFLIGISYSILSPIIVPFVVLYYAFGYIVWIYQLMHVYIATFDHGGRLWLYVFHCMMVAVVVFQLLMVGVFLLKELWFAAVFLAPLVVIGVIFWVSASKTYSRYGEYMVAEEGAQAKYAEQHFLENVRRSYIRDYNLPDVFEPCADKMLSDDYLPIDSLNADTDNDGEEGTSENVRLLGR